MTTIADIRAKFPQYEDMSDEALADAMHRKFYSDLPRDEFNAKIGLTPAAPAPEQMSTGEDMLRSLGSGIRGGIEGIAGMGGDIRKAQGGALSWIAGKLGASPETQDTVRNVGSRLSPFGGMPDSQQVREQVAEPLVGDALKHDPQTTAGDYAQTGGEFLPAALAGPGSFVRRLITQALLPAAGSETAGQMTEGTEAEPYARIVGALTGGLAPSVAGRAISPMRIPPERKAMVDVLTGEGVTPTAGQATGSRALRFAESELGGVRAGEMMSDQASAFTDAAMRKAGASGRATPDNMTAMRDRLGQGFDDISARNSLRVDQGVVDDMNTTMAEYMRVLPSEQKAIVRNLAQDIVDRFKAGKGTMQGRDYQDIRSRLSRMAKNASKGDPEFANALRGMRNSLDDGMSRSVRPEDAGQWGKLRREYGNMKVLERAATGGGENAAMGAISPAQLRVAATTGNRGAYARGEGDFSELSRAGNAVLSPLPDSGTASRLATRGIMNAPTAIGAIAGGTTGDVMTGLAGAAAGAAVPRIAGRALMSKPIQAWLKNQSGAAIHSDPKTAAIIAMLLANRGQGAIAPPAQ